MKRLRLIAFGLLTLSLVLPVDIGAEPQVLVPVILETRSVPFYPRYVGDLDLDGNMDIVGQQLSSAYELLEWDGSAFVQRLVMSDPVQMRTFMVADADADGIPEFMASGANMGDYGEGRIRIWEADADNSYGLRFDTSYPALDSSTPGDSDGDGALDFLMTPGYPLWGLQRLKATADNTYAFLPGLALPSASGNRVAIGAADFDGDGAPETVYTDYINWWGVLYENDAIILTQAGRIKSVELGTDTDNNGLGEFLVETGTGWILRESTGSDNLFQDVWTSNYDGLAVMADADGDGQAELFLRPNAALNTFTLSHRSGSSLITYVDSGTTFQSWPQAVTVPLYLGESNGAPLIAVRQGPYLHIATLVPAGQPPILTVDSDPVVVSEGETAENTGTISDPDAELIALTASIGTVTDNGNGTWSWSFPTSDGPTESQTVTITADDGNGGTAESSFQLIVHNVAPTPNLCGPTTGQEGTPVALTGSATDPAGSNDTITLTWLVTKDGTAFASGSGAVIEFTPDDNAEYMATLTASDEDGGSTATTHVVMIGNMAPTVTSVTGPLDPVDIANQPVSVGVIFSDPGTGDTHDVTWDWDDGYSNTQYGAISPASQGHVYADPGVYAVTVAVEDDDGDTGTAVYEFIVIYNPEGGFVTGGGWILSPVNTDYPYMQVEGQANFGFVSKYRRGASVPTGNTEFNFRAGDLNFRSESYEWLVIAGHDKAKYKGTGTINSGGNYGFMLTVVDNGNSGDQFRIKIWDKDLGDAVVYDNQAGEPDDGYVGTEIGGGAIKVHQ